MTDTIDLSAAVPLEKITIDITLPGSSKPSGWKIDLAGPQHPMTLALLNDVGRENLDREMAIELSQATGKKFKQEPESPDERRRKNVTKVCRRIIGWSPNPTFKNVSPQPIAFSVAAATDLFLRPEMGGFFIQITDYLNGERAFMRPSEAI